MDLLSPLKICKDKFQGDESDGMYLYGSMEPAFQDTSLPPCHLPEAFAQVGPSRSSGFECPLSVVDMKGMLADAWDGGDATLSPPAAAPEAGLQIAVDGATQLVGEVRGLTPAQIQDRIRESFGRAPAAQKSSSSSSSSCSSAPRPFVLRHPDGFVMAISEHLPSGVVFNLETIDEPPVADCRMTIAEDFAPAFGAASLCFVLEPPKEGCEWLSCKVTKTGHAGPPQHLFAVEVAVADAGNCSDTALLKQLSNAEIRLFTPAMQEKSRLVHQGTKVVARDAAGRVSVRWEGVGITEVSSSQSADEANASMALSRRGGRCGRGWYHIAVSAPGIADLWLRSSATELAKVVVKHTRCYATGRWMEKGIGPYADHSRCVPSHVGPHGVRLCCEGGAAR
jgi:hypothetical protein